MDGEKLENPKKNPRSKAKNNNKLNPYGTGPELNSGHNGGRRGLLPLRHLISTGLIPPNNRLFSETKQARARLSQNPF